MRLNINHYNDQLWTHEEATTITGGTSTLPWRAEGLSIKQQDLFPGDIFFASSADDLDTVFERGAAVAVVKASMPIPSHIKENFPLLTVPCVYEALRSLAKAARFRTHSLVISVQGFEQRRSLSNVLGAVSDLYEGGRHLSSAVAAMPDDCDFSVFGMSPSVRPDVVVINKCSQMKEYSILGTMPANGIVLINADDPDHLEAFAEAKAVGLTNILTYGSSENADARLLEQVVADNGVQTRCDILGEEIMLNTISNKCRHMPTLVQNMNMMLVASMLLKFADMPLQKKIPDMARSYVSSFDMTPDQVDKKLSILKPSQPQNMLDEAIFRVKNMVDTGKGRRTMILDQGAPGAKEGDFTLPSQLRGLDIVSASKKVSIFKNARQAVQRILKVKSLDHIVPEVLTPGDYVVFKSGTNVSRPVFAEALRLNT